MKTKDRLRALNVTKQASIKKFSAPPTDKIGKDGDLGICVVPKKGLHLFYKMGSQWYNARLHKDIKTHKDDVRTPSVEGLHIGNVFLRSDNDGNLKVRNKQDSDDVTIEAKKIHLNTGATGGEDKELKISYDDNNHTSFTVDSDGDLKIAVTDGGSATGNIQYNGGTFTFDGANNRTIALGQRPTSGAGTNLSVVGGQASDDNNQNGGQLILASGQSTGTGTSGHIIFKQSTSGSSGDSVNALADVASFRASTGTFLLDTAAGFDRKVTNHSNDSITSSGGTDDTDVDFRTGNKRYLELEGNVTNLNLIFPEATGNFVLLLKQDSTGTRVVSNYKVYESDVSAATVTDVKWPGGVKPTLTTSTNHVDILSFFWDADTQTAYATATLDFQD
jgi:hypothetical protein